MQFTPDLMPADINDMKILENTDEGRQVPLVQAPVFAKLILPGENNRPPLMNQASLQCAMHERLVTAANACHELEQPFFVLATQYPIEILFNGANVVEPTRA